MATEYRQLKTFILRPGFRFKVSDESDDLIYTFEHLGSGFFTYCTYENSDLRWKLGAFIHIDKYVTEVK